MISYKEAIELIDQCLPQKGQEVIPLNRANGRILSKDIVAKYDHPFFDNSTVDGYGIRFSEREKLLKVGGEISAGDNGIYKLKQNTAVRIFTGAPIPERVDTVVMQENVVLENGAIKIVDGGLKLGSNIRKQGGQIKKGAITLKKGSKISVAGIGFLASIGEFNVPVFQQAKVSVLVTGNEFLHPDEALQEGKIYDSNGVMLQTVLSEQGIESEFTTVKDDLDSLKDQIQESLATSDFMIITGGVSVGDYDFTKMALNELGFTTIFHKVKQKPGKPILYAVRDDGKIAFGLPGNPQSAIVGYYIYVLPILLKIMGANNIHLTSINIPSQNEIKKMDDGKTHFIPGNISENGFEAGTIQASHMLLSMANANAIAIIPEDKLLVEKGALITCKIIR
ncbi:MAG: molybdopterin molybdotransferase MoeA [Chitinophagales bacterium]